MKASAPNIVHAFNAAWHTPLGFTVIQEGNIMSTQTAGHTSVYSGLRGHSVGTTFPWLVMAKGIPGVSLEWVVRGPRGNEIYASNNATKAHKIALICKVKGIHTLGELVTYAIFQRYVG